MKSNSKAKAKLEGERLLYLNDKEKMQNQNSSVQRKMYTGG